MFLSLRRRGLPVALEGLEDRVVPTTITVSSGLASDLIAAINTANTNGQPTNTIDLSGTYDLAAIDNYWYGPNGLPAITSTLTIQGDPTNGAVIERDPGGSTPDFRLFYVAAAQSGLTRGILTLDNLTLANGMAVGGNSDYGGGGLGAGGAIFDMGNVLLQGVTITNCQAIGGNSGDTTAGDGGGGIGSGSPLATGNGGGFGGAAPGAAGGAGGSNGLTNSGGGGGFNVDDPGLSSGAGGGLGNLGGSGGGLSGAGTGGTYGDGGVAGPTSPAGVTAVASRKVVTGGSLGVVAGSAVAVGSVRVWAAVAALAVAAEGLRTLAAAATAATAGSVAAVAAATPASTPPRPEVSVAAMGPRVSRVPVAAAVVPAWAAPSSSLRACCMPSILQSPMIRPPAVTRSTPPKAVEASAAACSASTAKAF